MTSQSNTSSCCSTDGSCSSTTSADIPSSAITTVYKVSGMTCGHCEGSVAQEISAIDGVTGVKAVAASGEVTVTSAAPLDQDAVRAAVDEAGYELVGTV